MKEFHTEYSYTDRETKGKYVWLKYQSILKGSILDVGADKCHLKAYLGKDTEYLGIGLGEDTDQQVDLEREKIPFPDSAFDCVLCLDVLEHLDNIHQVFDELCRVTRRFVILSLPNPWAHFYRMLCDGDYRSGCPVKFYGLPVEPPVDRHKWFFSAEEAKEFILHRTEKNDMRLIQIDSEGMAGEGRGWRRLIRTWARMILLRPDLNPRNLYAGTLWAVLEKQEYGKKLV